MPVCLMLDSGDGVGRPPAGPFFDDRLERNGNVGRLFLPLWVGRPHEKPQAAASPDRVERLLYGVCV